MKQLGHISIKYESNGNPATVSNNPADPGGASYGLYQLASKTGTLKYFLDGSSFKNEFTGLTPGTKEFNSKWVELSKNQKFNDEQHDFIKKTHYDSPRSYATSIGLPDNQMLNEAIWSMGVQHGPNGAIKILKNILNADIIGPITKLVNVIYGLRKDYVKGLTKLSEPLKQTLYKRYDRELKDVLALNTVSTPAVPETTRELPVWGKGVIVKGVDETLKKKALIIIDKLIEKGWQPVVGSGLRTQAQQRAAVKAGNSTTMKSKHLLGKALDIIDKRYAWNIPLDHQFWRDYGKLANEQGLRWGGDWGKGYSRYENEMIHYKQTKKTRYFVDVAHIEVS